MEKLLEIMKRLRDPEQGCPWDREQTFKSILPYTLEEAHEVAAAIDSGNFDDLREELGDLLFQIVFYSQMASEQSRFNFSDIVDGICNKLIRRHPHVFADAKISNAEEQAEAWEEHKRKEKAAKRKADTFLLDDIPAALPALTRALKLHRKAATVGFDWPDIHGVFDKLEEEVTELKHEVDTHGTVERLEDEIGDLLFVMTILARHVGVNPETALRTANNKFVRRFHQMEQLIRDSGGSLEATPLDEMDGVWDLVKSLEKSKPNP